MLKDFNEDEVKDRAGVIGLINRYFQKTSWMWMLKSNSSEKFSGLSMPANIYKFILRTTRNKIKKQRINAQYGNFNGRIVIDRIRAQNTKNLGQKDPNFEVSLFSEMMRKIKSREERKKNAERFDFEVLFKSEEGIDRGGLLREALTTVTEELQSYYLPLFIPTANNKVAFGNSREKWTVNPSSKGPACIQAYEFIGKLIGMCLKSDQILQLDLPSIFWKKLLDMPLRREDLLQVDAFCLNSLDSIISFPKETFDGLETYFCASLSNGTSIDLIPNGKTIRVPYSRREEYAELVVKARLSEGDLQIEAVKRGLFKSIPEDTYAFFSWEEVEEDVCGLRTIDVSLLKKMTKYDVRRELSYIILGL